MTFKAYWKDRIVSVFLFFAAELISLLFLLAFQIPGILIGVVLGVIATAAVCGFFLEYGKRHAFYQQLKSSLKDLDAAYLAAEVLPQAGFEEGRILRDVLLQMGKSMTEHVSVYRRSVEEFREYIEMWVHEVKIPIAGMKLALYNEEDAMDLESQTDSREKLQEQIRRLDLYTDQVLYFARSEVAEKDYLIRAVSLKKTVGNVIRKMREPLQHLHFQIRTEGLEQTVATDGKWLEFILEQLVDNSIKYAAEGRERELCISCRARTDEMDESCISCAAQADAMRDTGTEPPEIAEKFGHLTLHIRDNGIGIPAQDLPRIFEKSFTGSNGRRRQKSTGMGLYIVKKLCHNLGHDIDVQSVEGEYTEFRLTFPNNSFYDVR